MPMVKVPFNGQLNSNEIFSAIYNMIISQQVFANNIKEGFGLVNKFKEEGTLYGDTKLFYSTDVLETHEWGNDHEASNLLDLDRPDSPKCQAIVIDTFRQIRLTVDNYLTKRAWGDEAAFSEFQNVMLGWINKTKEVYDNTLINTYVGTLVTSDDQNPSLINEKDITLSAASTIDDYAKRGLLIGQGIADLLVDLKDYSRVYNGYGFLRNYDPSDFVMVWNAKYKNEIRKVDLPTVFHNDGIVDKLDEEMLPYRYFGAAMTSEDLDSQTHTVLSGKVARAAKEMDVNDVHYFAADELPAETTFGSGYDVAVEDAYIENQKIICKLVHKEAIKYMSAFQVATEFWNARSLTENHYLTFGYGLDNLYEFPVIAIKEVNE